MWLFIFIGIRTFIRYFICDLNVLNSKNLINYIHTNSFNP
ncbi:hypothetical protein vBEcoMWL3_gp199 [Escherichia phage vB_EcoM_WL-3]|nr:hypothetical protein vBEcoMWL3_gp199 [Escherichia phage vB_EcoM_WL-3]